MRKSNSAVFGVKVSTDFSPTKAADKNERVIAKKQKRIDICTECPYPSCKKGICVRYKEERVWI